MIYFADASLTELGGVLVVVFGAFGTILVGFYNYARSREKDFEKSRNSQTDAFNKALKKLGDSLDANVAAHKEVAAAVTKSANEAAERNGHLAELQLKSQEMVEKLADGATKKIITAVQQVNKQNVQEQNVEHLHVKNKE